jgi:hypothetical protein
VCCGEEGVEGGVVGGGYGGCYGGGGVHGCCGVGDRADKRAFERVGFCWFVLVCLLFLFAKKGVNKGIVMSRILDT